MRDAGLLGTAPRASRRSHTAFPPWGAFPRHQSDRKPTRWRRPGLPRPPSPKPRLADLGGSAFAESCRAGAAEASPPPVAAPAQGSPISARPCDLRAAERLQPPKLDRGWGLRGGKRRQLMGSEGKAGSPPSQENRRTVSSVREIQAKVLFHQVGTRRECILVKHLAFRGSVCVES